MDCLRRRKTVRAVKIDVLTSRAAVAVVEKEWDALLDSTPCNRAFSSSAWFLAATEAAGSPLVVTARRDGRLAALLPLFAPNGAREAGFATRLADYNDVILGGATTETAREMIEVAFDNHPALLLRELREDAALLAALDSRFHIEHEPACPVLWTSLAGGYEAWLAERSRAFRKSLFRAERAAGAQGLIVRELDPSESGDGEIFLSLHDAHPRESCFAIEEHRAFVRRALSQLLSQRRMRAFGVLDGDRIVAIDLCAAGASSLCTWNGGYLPEYADVSPGNLLLAYEIRTACGEGIAEFDLGRGDENYKSSWATQRRALARLRVSR
jgi:CelD/BcsL family acetyltransferase involved in cellulose biosynthesis